MRSPKPLIRLTALAGLALLAACSDPAGARVVDGDRLLFVRQSPTAPALENGGQVAFWAKYGEDYDIRLPYVNGHDCLRFRLDDETLRSWPDGRRFQPGDSVRITIRLVDPDLYNFEFQPAGLRFNPDRPAELRVSYAYSDPDLDGDGDVDDRDRLEFDDVGFWRQETDGAPWTEIGTARLDATDEMRAELEGFTKYAMAGG
jgi:hypothetical protein